MALPVVIAEAEIAAGMAGLQICKANTAHFCQKYTFKAEQVCSPPARHFHSWTPEGVIALSQETLLAPQVCVWCSQGSSGKTCRIRRGFSTLQGALT